MFLRSLILASALTLGAQAQPFESTSHAPSHIQGDNFYVSPKVHVQEVRFKNQYGLEVAAKLFTPKAIQKGKRYPALIVGHPMGAVKEQTSQLYATKLAEKGFVTLSFDLSFWGQSAGTPRHAVLPDMYVEDFSAAVDYLGTRGFVDPEKIGVVGVCGSGGFALAAAKIDPRIKAITTVSMYDMGDAIRHGVRHSVSKAEREAFLKEAASERYREFSTHKITRYTVGTPTKIDKNSSPIAKEFYDFYRTKRGAYTPQGEDPKLDTSPQFSSDVKFINFYPFEDLDSISPRPILFITGDEAHSREFSQKAYAKAAQPKELYYEELGMWIYTTAPISSPLTRSRSFSKKISM
ncbi:alpha/beta hydrolase [Helicobacter ailurogastricus]|uniref:alpha/beta hydrolase n=1 Tax=Helicobacter ailurogastricus TaxID=1578720 RepID=UPI00244D8E79|nr:alpha/beta hydrolase [Helicobacter ailurogastricus]GMB89948.1 alpha/beta hydrolase [Helicobacter ailurogastricus]